MAATKKNSPKWMEKAGKAIITVEVTTKEGATRTGYGFFISEKGEAVASYNLFRHASQATVVTADGETLAVTQISGADDMFDVVRFKVAAPKKMPFLTVASAAPALNSAVYILQPAGNASKTVKDAAGDENLLQGVVSEVTKVKGIYDYYKIEIPLPKGREGYPLVNESGEAFALAQADATGKGKTYGISIPFIQSLQPEAADMFKRTYSEIGVRAAWSSDFDDASISLMLYSSKQDPQTYLETLNDFVAAFPDKADGYNSRASHLAFHRKTLAETEAGQLRLLDAAWNDAEKAAKLTPQKGDAFYNQSKLIFDVAVNDSALSYKNWNVPAASALLKKALAESDQPAYRLLEGNIAFHNQDFEQAYRSFQAVNQSNMASGMSFYLAAKSRQHLDAASLTEIIALIDSAVNRSLSGEASAYILENVELKMQAGFYNEAVKDYDKYYLMVEGKVNDGFYYYREQAKFRSGDLNGALNDINKALLINNMDAVYHAEKASVYLRLKDLPQAQASAEKAIELQPDFASAYRILGVSLSRQDRAAEACAQYHKARELGDPVVAKLIDENCNK